MVLGAADFFDLTTTALADLFEDTMYVWEAIDRVGPYIESHFANGLQPNVATLNVHPSVVFGDAPIFVGKGTKIHPSVYIEGPAIIGKNCEIRHGAYVRANTILADGAIVGHASETKNAVLLEHAAAPHFAYVGDSILGQRVNLGAGTKLSNVPVNSKSDSESSRRTIAIQVDSQRYDTGLTKFGAIIGDDVEVGCNTVMNPGVLIGPRTLVYALSSVPAGYTPADRIVKLRQTRQIVERRG